jgi:uncharacterized protein YdiU (UPF0061 family)
MLAGRQILPTDNIKDTALATNLKLLCGICTNWRMLYPLIEDAKPLENILEKFSIDYESEYLIMMQNKLGLQDKKESDLLLVGSFGRIIGKSRNRYDDFL